MQSLALHLFMCGEMRLILGPQMLIQRLLGMLRRVNCASNAMSHHFCQIRVPGGSCKRNVGQIQCRTASIVILYFSEFNASVLQLSDCGLLKLVVG
jgi:hypothetical protein